MKKIIALVLFLAIFTSVTPSQADPISYAQFRNIATRHRKELRLEGLSYMIGGGAGFTASLALGVSSEEVIPKIGYSLIQTLSAAAFYYGAVSYYEGDRLTQENDRIQEIEMILSRNSTVSASVRTQILNEMTRNAVQREVSRANRNRSIRGYVSVATALSSGLTIGFSKSRSTASNISLGFICLVSTVGAITDLVIPQSTDTVKDLFTFEPTIGPRIWAANLSYHW